MKVAWLTYGISPYKMALAQELTKYVELKMFLYDEKDKHRDKSFYDLGHYDFEMSILSSGWKKMISEKIEGCDALIDSMYSTPYGMYAVKKAREKGIKTLLQADGGIAKNRGFIINKMMSNMMNRHDCFLSSSEYVDKYFRYYGDKNKPIYHYRFSSLTEKDVQGNRHLGEDKETLKKKLGFSDRFSIVSVGQIIPRKGYDILLKVLATDRLCDKVDTYIVGGEPVGYLTEMINKENITNVHFPGSMSYEEVKQYYGAADLFVLCTREDIWGLVINEALSFGLPTITSNNCVAGLHFESALTFDVDDIKGYHDIIVSLMNDKNKYQTIKNNSLKEVASYTIENSAKDIYKALQDII